jgi:hypothetical protein
MLGDREMEPLELPPSHAEAMAEVDRLRHQALEPTPWRMHDEAMRMRALEAGARLAEGDSVLFGADGGLTLAGQELVLRMARWAYREATGREW